MPNKNPTHISVVGLGSLGGFLVKNLNDIDFVKEITIVDFDDVKSHNLNNSIYTSEDIGKKKTWALWSKLLYSKKKINTITDQYVGNNINFSSSDIVIDCRDIIVPNDPQITFKTFISGHYVCICNRINNDSIVQDGHYTQKIDKENVKYAASKVSRIISSKILDKILNSKDLHMFDILDIEKEYYVETNNKLKNCVVDVDVNKKVCNFGHLSHKIIEINKTAPIIIKPTEASLKKYIKTGQLKTVEELSRNLFPITNNPFSYGSYYLKVFEEREGIVVEVIPYCAGS